MVVAQGTILSVVIIDDKEWNREKQDEIVMMKQNAKQKFSYRIRLTMYRSIDHAERF